MRPALRAGTARMISVVTVAARILPSGDERCVNPGLTIVGTPPGRVRSRSGPADALRRPARFATPLRLETRPVHPKPAARAAAPLRPGDHRALGARAHPPRAVGGGALLPRRIRILDVHRVLDPPLGLPSRAEEPARRAAALDLPRRPPRPPQRPVAARDAAHRHDPARRRHSSPSSSARSGPALESRPQRGSSSGTCSTTCSTTPCTTGDRGAVSVADCTSSTCGITSRTTSVASG